MNNIYNFTFDERVAHCEKMLCVFERLPDGCFLKIHTTPSLDLVNRLKNKIHAFTEEIKNSARLRD